MRKLRKMIFLGSVKLDASKRFTMIKDAAEILNVGKDDNIMFYIDNGEIIIRKVLPEQGDMYKSQNAEFNEWARKRKMEIDLMPDEDIRQMCLEDLNVKIEHQKEYNEALKELHNN